MKVALRAFGVMAGLSAAILVGTAGAAQSEGANVIKCSNVFPELGGVIVFNPRGGFKGNCFEHLQDGTPGAEGATSVFDCSEQFPDIPPELLVGIQVITASGNVLTNCHIHA